jgi:hypothetical protein
MGVIPASITLPTLLLVGIVAALLLTILIESIYLYYLKPFFGIAKARMKKRDVILLRGQNSRGKLVDAKYIYGSGVFEFKDGIALSWKNPQPIKLEDVNLFIVDDLYGLVLDPIVVKMFNVMKSTPIRVRYVDKDGNEKEEVIRVKSISELGKIKAWLEAAIEQKRQQIQELEEQVRKKEVMA